MTATYALNADNNGIEITFSGKPSEQIREQIKKAGYRWHKIKKVWYAKQTEARLKLAESISSGQVNEITPEPAKKEKVNKYGVMVGDIFSASWGYEQTNVNFFQVIELVGTQSARVREVFPPMIKEEGICGMSADRTYKITRDILPPAPFSVFIRDQEKGDLKRIKSYHKDGSHPEFYLDSFCNAHYCEPGEKTEYESWYY